MMKFSHQLIRPILYILVSAFMFNHSSMAIADDTQPRVKILRVNNYEMSYVEKGNGEPLILVHGSLSDYRTWLPLLEELSETNRTIAVSLRHYYPEKWQGKGNDLSLQQHADDLAAFIKGLKVGPVNLLGHSRGGAVALLLASKHPQMIKNLILADPAPLTTFLASHPEVQADLNARKAKLKEVYTHYQHGDTESGLQVFVNYIAGPGAWEKTPETTRTTLRENAWTQVSLLKDIETPFSCSNANNIVSPVLLITGERSASIYSYMHSALQPCLTKVHKAIIADAGHMMFRSNPTAFIFEVQDFISSM